MDIYYHIDTTVEIARNLGFGWCASIFMAEGNMDIDVRYWGEENKPKHGQTPANPKTGKPTMTPEEAKRKWKQWINQNERKARKSVKDRNCRAALYYLGRALHAIQES